MHSHQGNHEPAPAASTIWGIPVGRKVLIVFVLQLSVAVDEILLVSENLTPFVW